MIKVHAINKFFNKNKANEVHALNNINMEFPETGLVCLMGPSGCGKTTFLNVLSGLDKNSSGIIEIDNARFKRYQPNKWDNLRISHIGYVFQNYVLLNDETVYDNLRIVLDILRVPEPEQKERITEALKVVGLEKFEHRKAKQLSGGQQQRVAIARAIVKSPDIIFADEPTGNLDDKNSRMVMDIIKAVSKTRLVILVTHNKELGLFYSDYIVEMIDGKAETITTNTEDKKLSLLHTDNIYLDTLDKSSFSNPSIDLEYYHEGEEKVKIRLIAKNGNLYIDLKNANTQPILVNEVNSIKILEHVETEKPESEVKDFALKPLKVTKKRSAISFFQALKVALKRIFFPKLGRKFMYFGLIFIGFVSVFAVSSLMGVFYRKPDNYKGVADSAYAYEGSESLQDLKDRNQKFHGENFIAPYDYKYGYEETIGSLTTFFGEDTRETIKGSVVPIEDSKYEIGGFSREKIAKSLSSGRMPENDNEIVVTKKSLKQHANRQKEIFNSKNYLDRYISSEYSYDGKKLKIVGISDIDDYYFFVHPLNAMGFYLINEKKINKPIKVLNSLGESYYPLHDADKIKTFDSSITENIKKFQTITTNFVNYEKVETVNLDKEEAVLGVDKIIIPLLSTAISNGYGYFDHIKENLNGSEFSVEDGKLYYQMARGRKYEVIGFSSSQKYVVSRKTMAEVYNTVLDNSPYKLLFYDNVKNYQEAFDIRSAQNLNTLNKNTALNRERMSGRYSLLIMPILLIGFSFLFLVLIMRGSLIDEVYRIGVYRAIGIKKFDCKKLFYVEVLLLTLLTSIPGVLVGYMFAVNFDKLGVITYEWWYLVVTIGGIFLVNAIAGMIPINVLLRKTPAQILSKYDI